MLEKPPILNHKLFSKKIWIESQLTSNYISPHIPFSKETRFKWCSIYWPQKDNLSSSKYKNLSGIALDARKVSKIIDEQQKNEVRINLIKKSILKGQNKVNSPRKQSFTIQTTKKPYKLSKINQSVVNRLTFYQPKLQSTLRDRHGNRCNLFQNPQAVTEQQEIRYMSKTTGFSTSRKFNLQLPHNYFPGPGTYNIKRYLSQLNPSSEKQFMKKEKPKS